ncbi:MAG: hypothetical protein HY774_12090 [Acidobacteria bacterium]|nr:hypothetical protein [Acidobacteriota bacterium]
MKINDLKRRLQKDCPMTTISLRIPEDVIEDLKRVAPQVGFSGYQPLIRAYIGQGLRQDLARLEGAISLTELVENLRKRGVDESILESAMAEINNP